MNYDDFWKLIEQTFAEAEGDLHRQTCLVQERLRRMSMDEIRCYAMWYGRFTGALWNPVFFVSACLILNEELTDNSIHFLADEVVARGRAFYLRALADPEWLDQQEPRLFGREFNPRSVSKSVYDECPGDRSSAFEFWNDPTGVYSLCPGEVSYGGAEQYDIVSKFGAKLCPVLWKKYGEWMVFD